MTLDTEHIRERICPVCMAGLVLTVTASFKGANDAWGPDGYAYTDLEVIEDDGLLRCASEGAKHFEMSFGKWQAAISEQGT